MKYSIVMLSTVLLLAGAPSLANAASEFSRNALYLRGGITASFDATILFGTTSGVGVGGALGYRLHPRIALEGQFEWQGNQSVTLFATSGSLSRWDATGNAKLFLATGRFQPFIVGGVGYVRGSGSCVGDFCTGGGAAADSFLARLGLGLDVYITKNIGIYAEGAYMWATSDVAPGESFPDFGTVGAGVILAF